ncbi:class I SAM-dependent methyltransferase [Crocinitomicaceae bacterium]|jgi:SAM-dependent methyltransferase|nr:class I SAM-dependent methyltransferase [Crocinitomicaceae bacterium]
MSKDTSKWLEINRDSWDQRSKMHLNSDFYDTEGFKKGKNTLNDIEIGLLGNIENKKILHLQCHFGLDTFSLEQLDAHVVGVDFSPVSISYAEDIKKEMGFNAEFICSNIYDLDLADSHDFDMVFCSYGICGWLPDLHKWAQVISKHLKSGDTFTIVDFHPSVWMFDDDFKEISYSYFNEKPYVEVENGSYASPNSKEEISSIWWNHSLSEIITSLMNNEMDLLSFKEYDYSPYDCFRHTVKISEGKYRIQHLDSNIPMVYSLVLKKK